MQVRNRQDAEAILRMWGNNIRPSILKPMIQGMTLCQGLSKDGSEAHQGYLEALEVFQRALGVLNLSVEEEG